MVEIRDLQVGMLVKVVDEWLPNYVCDETPDMDQYLGEIVTIRHIGSLGRTVKIEGCEEWWFNKYCFDHIVEEEIEPPNMGDILSLFGGGVNG